MNKDYIDLKEDTDAYRKSCEVLYKAQEAELHCNTLWKEKEMLVSKERWGDLQAEEITAAKYNAYVKNETFQEKLNFETAKMKRKMAETRNNSLREKLYTTKKQIN